MLTHLEEAIITIVSRIGTLEKLNIRAPSQLIFRLNTPVPIHLTVGTEFQLSRRSVSTRGRNISNIAKPEEMISQYVFMVSVVACSLVKPIHLETTQAIGADYKVVKYTYSREDDTDVMNQEPPKFQLIPLDFLCEFCQVVILKLKERQINENDFENRIRAECFNSTNHSNSLCDVINRVNLDRLKSNSSEDLCQSQGMCKKSTSSELQDLGPPGISPNQKISLDNVGDDVETHLSIDEQSLNTTLHVAEINPYN